MGWLATSPYGPLRNASWICFDCGSKSTGDPRRADPDAVRAGAIAHVEATGHHASFARGTLEAFYPMATTAATPEGST